MVSQNIVICHCLADQLFASAFWLRQIINLFANDKLIAIFARARQEPITRSVQLPYIRATVFSQVVLFLDTPFPRKLLFPVTSASKQIC